jgi:hypothetical protein
MWLMAGIALLPLAVIPGALDQLASWLGIAYGPALLLVLGLGYFALLSLHFSTELSRLEERTRVLAEEVALLRNEFHSKSRQASPAPPRHESTSSRVSDRL